MVNLKSMVRYLQAVGVPEDRVILITPPPLCEAAWEKQCLMQGNRERPHPASSAGRAGWVVLSRLWASSAPYPDRSVFHQQKLNRKKYSFHCVITENFCHLGWGGPFALAFAALFSKLQGAHRATEFQG